MLRWLSIAFRDGGWAMWAIFAFGLAAVAIAARFAWRGEQALLVATRWLTAALIASGCFGFCVDLQAVMRYSTVGLDAMVAAPDNALIDRRTRVVLEGLNESLYCLSSASMFTVMIALLVVVGYWRSPQGRLPRGLSPASSIN
jgi:hypothetical protein